MFEAKSIPFKKKFNCLCEQFDIYALLRRMNIRKRLLLSFFVLSLIPIVFVSIFSLVNTYRDTEYKNEEYFLNVSYQVANNINYLFDKYIDKLERISYHSAILADVYNYIHDGMYRNKAVEDRIRLTLASIAGDEEGIDSVAIYTGHGDKFNYGFPMVEGEFFLSNIAQNGYESSDIVWRVLQNGLKDNFEPHIILSKDIKFRYDKNDKGFAVISIRRDYIDEVCKNNTLNNNHYIAIVNESGILISHPDRNRIHKQYNPEILKEIDRLEDLKKDSKNVSNIFRIKTKEDVLLVSYDILNQNNWTVISVYPDSHLVESTIHNGRIIVVFALICIIFSFAFSLVVTKSIRSPVVSLIAKMEKVGKGDLDMEIPENDSYINDEHVILTQGFNDMTYKLNNLINDVYHSKIKEKELEFLIKEAELNALQQQINPHFLYNVLEAIFWMAQLKGHDEISEMITALGNFFRTSINNGLDYITISDEIENVKNYVYLQRIRLNNRFTVRWDIEEQVKEYRTIKLILQPIIENAIVHGLKDTEKGGVISIRCFKRELGIIFEIRDNGTGIKPEVVRNIQSYIDNSEKGVYKSVGVKNVNQRIKLFFGDRYGVRIASQLGEGTSVQITIPAFKSELDIHHMRADGEVENKNV